MGIIVEIILTIFACIRLKKAKKGWAFGLIPLGAVLIIGFIIGLGIGLGGGSSNNILGFSLILDVIAVIALIWIIIAAKPVKPVETGQIPVPFEQNSQSIKTEQSETNLN